VTIFLVFGGNVEETSPIVQRYIDSVCKQIVDLEGRIFEINGLHVSFHFEELPNDMKMLAMLGRELSNSATFFSTFANVSTNDCTDLRGTFGSSPSCKWKPWQYANRVTVLGMFVCALELVALYKQYSNFGNGRRKGQKAIKKKARLMTRTKQMMEMTETISNIKANVLPLKAIWIRQIKLSEF